MWMGHIEISKTNSKTKADARGNDTECEPLHVSSVELGRYCHRLVVVIEGSISDVCVAGRRLHQSVGTSRNKKRDHQYEAQGIQYLQQERLLEER